MPLWCVYANEIIWYLEEKSAFPFYCSIFHSSQSMETTLNCLSRGFH